jgi:hypothetical protein
MDLSSSMTIFTEICHYGLSYILVGHARRATVIMKRGECREGRCTDFFPVMFQLQKTEGI